MTQYKDSYSQYSKKFHQKVFANSNLQRQQQTKKIWGFTCKNTERDEFLKWKKKAKKIPLKSLSSFK